MSGANLLVLLLVASTFAIESIAYDDSEIRYENHRILGFGHDLHKQKPCHPPSAAPTPSLEMFHREGMLEEVLKPKPKHKPTHPPSPAPGPTSEMFDGEGMLEEEILKHKPEHKPTHPPSPSPSPAPSPKHMKKPCPPKFPDMADEEVDVPLHKPPSMPPKIAPTPSRANLFGLF